MDMEMLENVMLLEGSDKFECIEESTSKHESKFEILGSDIFDKRSIVTVDSSSSEYSDYCKPSSSRPSSGNSNRSTSKSRPIIDPDDVKPLIRKSRLVADEKIKKSSTSQAATISKKPANKDDPNEDRCDYCNRKDSILVCCDFCPSVFHPKCHTPPLKTIPKDSFQCYRCYYEKHYEENPLPHPPRSSSGKYTTAYLMKEIQTMKIVPFTLPESVKSFVKDLPPLMPNDEFKRKFKRKRTDTLNNCYICNRTVTLRNSNQCQFCSNTIHLDCDPRPSCSTRLYAWRCSQHIENFLDTYLLDSSSSCKRLKLWKEHAGKELKEDKVVKKFVDLLEQQATETQTLEAARTMLDLKDSRRRKLELPPHSSSLSYSSPFSHYSLAERRMLLLNKFTLYSDIFTENPKAIAAFIPAFKSSSSIEPIVYDGSPLSLGTSASCTFNLRTLPFRCSNMSEKQLVLLEKQGVHYLYSGIGGYTRVNDIFLGERYPNFSDLCQCLKVYRREYLIRSHVAVFPCKVYNVQLGCAFFHLVFSPLHQKRSSVVI